MATRRLSHALSSRCSAAHVSSIRYQTRRTMTRATSAPCRAASPPPSLTTTRRRRRPAGKASSTTTGRVDLRVTLSDDAPRPPRRTPPPGVAVAGAPRSPSTRSTPGFAALFCGTMARWSRGAGRALRANFVTPPQSRGMPVFFDRCCAHCCCARFLARLLRC